MDNQELFRRLYMNLIEKPLFKLFLNMFYEEWIEIYIGDCKVKKRKRIFKKNFKIF